MGTWLNFRFASAHRALWDWEIFLYGKHARNIACIYMRVCARTCIHHDFRDDFSTDLSTAMAQMHVTPYVPFVALRLALPAVPMSSVSTASHGGQTGWHCHTARFHFSNSFKKKSRDAFSPHDPKAFYQSQFSRNFKWIKINNQQTIIEFVLK